MVKPELQEQVQAPPRSLAKTLALVALALVVVVLSFFVPSALFKIEDRALLQGATPRGQQSGSLSGGSYFLWALRARSEGPYWQERPEDINYEEFCSRLYYKLQVMADEGGLPQMLVEAVLMNAYSYINEGVYYSYSVDDYGFERWQFYYYNDMQGWGIDFAVTIESRTGKATELYLSGSGNTDLIPFYEETLDLREEFMNNYLNWIGVGKLEDWVPTESGNMQYEHEYEGYHSATVERKNEEAGLVAHLAVNNGYSVNLSLYVTG